MRLKAENVQSMFTECPLCFRHDIKFRAYENKTQSYLQKKKKKKSLKWERQKLQIIKIQNKVYYVLESGYSKKENLIQV